MKKKLKNILKMIKERKNFIRIEQLDESTWFARVGHYSTSGQSKRELNKNILKCIILNINLLNY